MRYVYEEEIIEQDTGWIGGDTMVEARKVVDLGAAS